MDVQFLIFERVEELDLAGPWEFIGLLSERKHCSPPRLVTLNEMTPLGEHGMRFVAHTHFSEAGPCDVVFVPGGSGARSAMEDDHVIEFLQQKALACEAVLSVCTGSYLMQKAGLLDGRRATTHWAFLKHLRDDPRVELVEQRFVRDGNIWTSAGVSAGMDMTLAFIASCCGESVAADVQLDAEYFPADTVYGRPFDREDVSEYIRRLSQSA